MLLVDGGKEAVEIMLLLFLTHVLSALTTLQPTAEVIQDPLNLYKNPSSPSARTETPDKHLMAPESHQVDLPQLKSDNLCFSSLNLL